MNTPCESCSRLDISTDGFATGITYGLAGQGGQPWIQSYTPTSAAADYVIHDQQGTPLGYVQSGASYAFGTDNLGSVTSVVSSCGCTVATYAYDPYGNLTTNSGTDATDNLIGYTGQLSDTGTGASTLYVHDGNRWYSPNTGNFTTQDTSNYLDDPANGNRYAYASDNPANYEDPTGLESSACGLSSVLLAYGLAGAAASGVGLLTLATGGGAVPVIVGLSASLGFSTGIANRVGGIFGTVTSC